MMDYEGSLDGFIYDGLLFEDGGDDALLITDQADAESVLLQAHHLDVLLKVLLNNKAGE